MQRYFLFIIIIIIIIMIIIIIIIIIIIVVRACWLHGLLRFVLTIRLDHLLHRVGIQQVIRHPHNCT